MHEIMHFLNGSSWQATEPGKRLSILPEVIKYMCIQSYLSWTEGCHSHQVIRLEKPSIIHLKVIMVQLGVGLGRSRGHENTN